MTEQEAIEMMRGYQITDTVDRAEWDAFGMAISALEEIQQYRALGTVKDLKALRECCTPQYLGENTAIEYRYGKCKCGTVVKSYQKFCDNCGVRLEWSSVRGSEDK